MNARLLAIGGIGTLFLVGIVARLGYLQITRYKHFEEIAASQESPYSNPELSLANRGKIFARSRDGQEETPLLLASVRREYDLAINPQTLADPERAFAALLPLLALDSDDFFAKAAKKNDPFEIVKKELADEEIKAVERLLSEKSGALAGVLLAPEKRRFYPGATLAAHVIGFVGSDDAGNLKGRYGIEQYFEEELAGGVDVALTIDPRVALFGEELLEIIQERWHPAAAGILVMEPRTGRILAMNAKPGFDPNHFYEANLSDFLNPFIQARVEPGSVIKPLTLAAAIDAGAVTPETTYYDKGFREFDDARINNFDKKGRGTVTMQDVLSQSLNTGAVFAMERLGKEKFRDYFARFGLGEKTDIALAGEIAGDIGNLKSPRMIEFATASFGQGIATTPLALARALAALANDGWLMKPIVAESVGEKRMDPERVRQVVGESAAHAITRMLVEVVDTKLAEGKGKISGYSVAAKTGTAQLPDVTSGGYSEDFLHTFFGYAPAYNPKFFVFLYLQKPQGVIYASHTLTEPFRAMMQFLLTTFEVPPDRVEDTRGKIQER